jgi:anti-anti-sigma factor
MNIVQTRQRGITCLTISGPTNGILTWQDEKSIRETLKEEKDHLLFDLSALEYLRSAVLSVILEVAKEMRRRNGKVVLCTVNEYVKEIFEVSGVGPILPIADSVESGINALS